MNAPNSGQPVSPGGLAALTTGSVAKSLAAELHGPADLALTGLNIIDSARPGEMTFVRSARYAAMWATSKASACLVSRGIDLPARPAAAGPGAILVVPDADLALIQVIRVFQPADPPPPAGVHPSAIIEPGATIDPTASIGPMCIISTGATIGPRVVLHARVTIGPHVRIGEGTEIEPGAVVHHRCQIGRRCLIHSNATIGADGFGFRPSPDGRGVIKIPHAGIVEIHDDVELGAGTCVDRGKFGPTVIGAGTKIDNLVQIAHNVRIGRGCLIAARTAFGGSTRLGDGVMVGGAAAVSDNLVIGSGARVGGAAAVMEDMPAGETWIGYPAKPRTKFFREVSALAKMVGQKRGPRAPRKP